MVEPPLLTLGSRCASLHPMRSFLVIKQSQLPFQKKKSHPRAIHVIILSSSIIFIR
jgi:hypothetical protein